MNNKPKFLGAIMSEERSSNERSSLAKDEKALSRRGYLAAAGGVVAVVVIGGVAYYLSTTGPGPTPSPTPTPGPTPTPTPAPTATPTPTKKVDIDFVMWAFDTPLQERNATEFAAAYKRDTGVDTIVRPTSLPYDAYKASIISRFEGGTKTDVLYVEDNWFSLWENAGWIAPMEKYRPEIRQKYEPDLMPGVLDALTSRINKGMLVGLPYYVDTLTFMYDKRIIEEAGLAAPPTTWNELLDHADQVKAKVGLARPIAFAWKLAEWTFEEVLFALMYSRGERFLNADGSANLDEGSAMHQVLQWIEEAGVTRQLIDPASTEMVCENVMEGMKGKLYAYTVLPSYFLFFTNISDAPAAGDWINAMMPGTGDTTQLVRFYAMTEQAATRGADHIDACYDFIQWEGGMYDRMGTGEELYIKPREFALRDGLPFGLTGLLDDPAVQNFMKGWINPDIAKAQAAKTNYIEAKWSIHWEEWRASFEKEVQNVLYGLSSPEESLGKIRDEWNRLKG